MDKLDIALLYLVMKSEQGEPCSTWKLASQMAKTPTSINRLDQIFRYRLKNLAKQGLLQEHKVKGHTYYTLNPKGYACVDGSLIILSNPITVIACPHIQTCNEKCQITFYKKENQIKLKGCKLLENAPQDIRTLIYERLAGK